MTDLLAGLMVGLLIGIQTGAVVGWTSRYWWSDRVDVHREGADPTKVSRQLELADRLAVQAGA